MRYNSYYIAWFAYISEADKRCSCLYWLVIILKRGGIKWKT